SAGEPRAGLARLLDDTRPGRPAAPEPVVGVDARRVVAATRRPAKLGRRTRRRACRPRRARGRRGVRGMGGQVAPDGGRMGARGGQDGATYVWGDTPEPAGERYANYWHGDFPWRHDADYGRRQPVGTFPPNGYGLHDMAGNVWEWTTDWYAEGEPDDTPPCCV